MASNKFESDSLLTSAMQTPVSPGTPPNHEQKQEHQHHHHTGILHGHLHGHDSETTGQHDHEHHFHLPQLHFHPHLGLHNGRLREFFRPNGKKVKIASTPEEHDQIKRQISNSEKDHEFDLFIHGSPEHLEAIRELHDHHQQRRNTLRERHANIYDEIENVKADLDTLATELHMITEHGVALDANFSKYGYSAHLRTKDDDSAHSTTKDHSFDHGSIHTNDRNIKPLKFWKRPVVRQYLHKGLLWRSVHSGEVASFELFADLLYVGIIEVIGDAATENATGVGLLHFIITFFIGWKIWADLTVVINWFEVNDIFQRLCVVVYLVCLLGFTTNLIYGFESTYAAMIGFYLAERFFQCLYFLWVGYLVPTIRAAMVCQSIVILIVSAFWIGSIHIEWPNQLGVIFPAIFLDLFGYVLIIVIFRWSQRMILREDNTFGRRLGMWIGEQFEFFPAVNIEHRIERTNAFVTLVFGSSVLAILYQNQKASYALSAFFGKSCLALIQAFAFNWMYFEIDAANTHVHAIRRHALTAMIWMSGHIPFIMGYVLAAASMSRLVLAHDCSNTDVETLGETYSPLSESEVPTVLRWFYCAGLATALWSMTVISISHIHKTIPNARLKKGPRLWIRGCIGLIICLLPLASHETLNSLNLMSITCCLVVLALSIDLYGVSCVGDHFWRGGFCDEAKKNVDYRATCTMTKKQRREVEKKMKRGDRIIIEDLLNSSQTASETSSTTETLTVDTLTANPSEENIKPRRPKLMQMHSTTV